MELDNKLTENADFSCIPLYFRVKSKGKWNTIAPKYVMHHMINMIHTIVEDTI